MADLHPDQHAPQPLQPLREFIENLRSAGRLGPLGAQVLAKMEGRYQMEPVNERSGAQQSERYQVVCRQTERVDKRTLRQWPGPLHRCETVWDVIDTADPAKPKIRCRDLPSEQIAREWAARLNRRQIPLT